MVDDASNVPTGATGATGPTGTTGTTGITEEQKTKGAVAYIFGLVTGVIIFVIANDDRYLKFHGLQAIVYSICAGILAVILAIISIVLMMVPYIGCCFGLIIYLIIFIIFLYLWYGAYMVYTTGAFRMPVIADFVEKNLLK